MEKKSRLETNMGLLDRMVRLCAGFGLIVVGSVVVQGAIGTILLVVGIVAVLTAAIGFCPGYVPFGISTRGFPSARPELMEKMMTQCCGRSSESHGCREMFERLGGTSGGTRSGQGRE